MAKLAPATGLVTEIPATSGADVAAACVVKVGDVGDSATANQPCAIDSTFAAQMKSFIDRPPTSWVDQCTTQRL